ncbi:AfsR/SARP family transcriptional regulator [Actinophytocola glycyrrhizae]|uniref:BTAD domain-containing putative transcriptional regulator n=1 Tax=Actinophytocola glycyrrhizae TaxID=2044873 RepID=A0ABV9RWQ6_9PSEU
MEFGVLGALRLAHGNRSCVPTSPKGRQLLALLMVNANQMVPVHACVDELWQADPPRSAVSTLQTYVLQIRRLLRAVPTVRGQEVLTTHNMSYQLHVPAESFDRGMFESLVGRARAAIVQGDDRRAAELFDSALGLWRGSALADVPDGPTIAVHRIGLEETRFGVLEQRIEAYLRLGRHHELLAELGTLADTHPLHENVQAQFMVALYRSGRQAQAIEMFHRLRTLLFDQLGLDPVPRMRRLYEAILAADPMLEVSALRQRPDQLPASGDGG